MPLVTPTPIPAYPPAPQPTDDRVTFSTKAFALSGSYEPQRIIFNTVAGEVYTNALWSQTKAGESAASASQAATSASNAASSVTAVNQTVADILAAKDAIQAGPVASVNARTGVVTGLAETAAPSMGTAAMSTAPLGQWATFNSSGTAGADWPTSLGTAWWNVFTFGTGTRKTQRATQIYAGGQQGWVFERQLQDSTWSPWQRLFSDRALIEFHALFEARSATTNISFSNGSIQTITLYQNTSIVMPAPRDIGDQLTLRIIPTGAFSASFSGTPIRLPIGASLPTVGPFQRLTLTFVPRYDGAVWDAFIGGVHES
ncbi:hypothetical protein HNP33_003695 [Comamonas odontotermitis]|uniref:Tail fiber protein n=1 Tax=Comamonas odontotermitis TaxID=379895 RepID=A0ABR6RK72_9BURK|nr:hypothetical protein [Comamonas odontotermitis]MBB6579581.1 hypothetical protein [Comamonas odontotermitis]